MGFDLRPPDDHNPNGFFEDRDFLKLNDRILAAAGGDFIHPPSRERILAQEGRFRAEISELVRSRDSSNRVWGWKTTTTCLTLELFLAELSRPRLVVVIRNPLAVARSQLDFSRDELGLVDALELVGTFYSRVWETLKRDPQIPVVLVSYEDLLRNPGRVAGDLATFLELSPSSEQIRRAASLVASRRRLRWERAKLASRSWRSLQLARLRKAKRVFREDGASALAALVAERWRNGR